MTAPVTTNPGLPGFPSINDPTRLLVHMTAISSGTDETNVAKVVRANLLLAGVVPKKINIASIRWASQGFTYLKLSWDHTADDTAMVLNGNGYDNFESVGCLRDPNTSADTVTGAIGDLLLSSVGATANATYDITIECQLSL